MFKPKGKEPVLAIARKVYEQMPDSFYGIEFIKKVKSYFRFQGITFYDDTPLRMMRLLKGRKEINFFCQDRPTSLYVKL